MDALGLRNYDGRKLHRSNLAALLGNPFYAGVLRVKGQHFKGVHEPLVSQKLFQEVQSLLKGKVRKKVKRHRFLFRRLLICGACGRLLYGEVQKSNVYYRCQTKGCPTKCVRESYLAAKVCRQLASVQLLPVEAGYLDRCLAEMDEDSRKVVGESLKAIRLQIASISLRLDQLTDAYLDGVLEKEDVQKRKQRLLLDLRAKEATESELKLGEGKVFERIGKFLELAKSLSDSFETAIFDNRRRLVETVFSNFDLEHKKLTLTMHLPFNLLFHEEPVLFGGLTRDTARLHPYRIDAPESEGVTTRKPMSEQQLRGWLEYLVTRPDLLPGMHDDELSEEQSLTNYELPKHHAGAEPAP